MKTEKINEQELNNVELDAETLNDFEQTELKGGAGESTDTERRTRGNLCGAGCDIAPER